MPTSGEVTQLLVAFRGGDRAAMDELLPLVYDELHKIAHRQMRRRGRGQATLQTTALVNEAYLKLVDQKRASWNDRTHFLSVAAIAMRQILVSAARSRGARKRGGDVRIETFEEAPIDARADEILAIDEAMHALEELNPRLSRLVELRFFGGLTVEETAEAMEISTRTVKRDWRKARAFLHRTLAEQSGEDAGGGDGGG